jgi:acetylornithine/succinyldiaminopimelate/putrescine aminotransferase
MAPFRIVRAVNDLIFDEDGRSYIDLFTSHGTAWLGHVHPAVVAAVTAQMEKVWMTGVIETHVRAEARKLVNSFFPSTHELVALYSTGMEAAEFVLRLARVTTGKNDVVGFAGGMHGKSLATAFLCWDNRDGVQVPGFHRLPFVPACPEEEILGQLETILATGRVSAVFLEPLQGTGGGHRASERFYQTVHRLCRRHEALLVFDEILTGFHRTGPAFFFSELGFVPDVILLGKGFSNGFPASAVVAHTDYPARKEMLPGSTFAGNPLAAAAVAATLREIQALDLRAKVGRIADIISAGLAPLRRRGIPVRGLGAMWVVELPAESDPAAVMRWLYERGVAAGSAGRQLRLLPAATIEEAHLETACAAVAAVVGEAGHG